MALAGPALGLLGGLFGKKGEKKRADEQRRAQIGGANLGQQMSEDKRLARLNLGQSILGGLKPGGGTGGRVSASLGIDPAILAELSKRREYDFSQGIPDQNVGEGSSLLGGLLGGAGNLLSETDMIRSGRNNSSGIVPVSGAGAVGPLSGSAAPVTSGAPPDTIPMGGTGIDFTQLLKPRG
jgi:hypothetical protein